MKIIKIKKKVSNYAERIISDIFFLKSKYIKNLKSKADKSKNKSYRILFHNNNRHLTHEMMICFKKNAVVPIHKHPRKRSESYHIVEGSMDIYFFKNNGKPICRLSLSKKNNQIFYRLSSSIFHLLVPTSKYLVYHEIVTGPFLSKEDIIYPKWLANFDTVSKIKLFIKKNKNEIKKL